ncbi:ABC transporter ATP-binding protein [Roseibium salinum]|uniref:Sn-glycerol-3-phosphate ABC transporter ATP-binding protein UgpC n=1 Tax=Roseibium salinum TaxID=1604349 RepID=A0ABT3QWF3_9HYPH|nr:sn-glycerol-3-phosphate ABC transporter ATP-binding protein UgpC [Roseibium sp. DSM 29163]MCX2721259.1 sn-glycerol-3-phosphate ABC transporter ATP-binding protein UgpC [Roseibium sp. DSM 29163]
MGVQLRNVRKVFGEVGVIHDVSMDIPTGDFAVFVGPSGCGKSTLLRMIAGLEDTTAGAISIEGTDVTNREPAKRGVAMVFQSYALYPHLSVFENMAFSMRLRRAPKGEVREKVLEAARILQLEDHLEKKPSQLSGGQRQRVAIGRAIVRQPKVFLFDEPLSNLDAELRVQMRLELARLHKQIGATMIYVTHDQVEAMTLADRIFVLKEGIVQQAGKPLDLYDDPDNRFVAGFIGSPAMNFLAGKIVEREGESLRIAIDGTDALVLAKVSGDIAPGTAVTVGLRPEHLDSAETGIPVTVEMAEDLGGVSYLHTHLPDGREVVVEWRGSRHAGGGEAIRLTCAPEQVLVFDKKDQRVR